MVQTKPIFGTPEEGAVYIQRPGAYAVIINAEGLVGLVEVDGLLFLPGGGCEGDESLLDCLEREVLEETGRGIQVLWVIGEAGEYIFTGSGEKRHYFKLGTFYCAEFKTPILSLSGEHVLHWLSPQDALGQLNHQSQVWALEQVLSVLRAGL